MPDQGEANHGKKHRFGVNQCEASDSRVTGDYPSCHWSDEWARPAVGRAGRVRRRGGGGGGGEQAEAVYARSTGAKKERGKGGSAPGRLCSGRGYARGDVGHEHDGATEPRC